MEGGKGRSSASNMHDVAVGARELKTRARCLHVGIAMASITVPIRMRSLQTARIIRGSNRGIATAGDMQDVAIGAHATKTQGRGGLIGRRGTASVRLPNNRARRTAARAVRLWVQFLQTARIISESSHGIATAGHMQDVAIGAMPPRREVEEGSQGEGGRAASGFQTIGREGLPQGLSDSG